LKVEPYEKLPPIKGVKIFPFNNFRYAQYIHIRKLKPQEILDKNDVESNLSGGPLDISIDFDQIYPLLSHPAKSFNHLKYGIISIILYQYNIADKVTLYEGNQSNEFEVLTLPPPDSVFSDGPLPNVYNFAIEDLYSKKFFFKVHSDRPENSSFRLQFQIKYLYPDILPQVEEK
ncbi:MAG TPA: hypothetical protein VKC90_12070, partial [Chitinophagaceae bacterium]|nr:hypothetical protein [Chitinophagaceae bacterium]